jgi:WD40 repeat protein
MNDLVGQTLGQYRIVEPIGEGGMATVYKAYQPGLDRYVAVKVLPPIHAKTPGFSERFLREAKAIAGLHHPNILPIYDFGQDDGYSFIVMRYIEGARTLRDVMAEPLSLGQIAGVIEQIAAALDHAHRQGVIHRDVKPVNVLMDGDWALLTDFGLAKITEASVKLTGSGVGVGTPAYMSPEQGQGLEIDHRTDIYSLGIILFEMLTGKIPHEAETPFAIVLKRVTEPLPMPRSMNPEIPESIERVILKALATDPADRFESVGEMAKALRRAGESLKGGLVFEQETVVPVAGTLEGGRDVCTRPMPASVAEGEGVAVKKEAVPSTVLPARREVPMWAWAALGAVLVLVVALGWVILGGRGAEPASTLEAIAQATTLVAAAQTPPPARTDTLLPPTPTPLPTDILTPTTLLPIPISPDNAHEVVQVDLWGKGALYSGSQVSWSPDGALLAVESSLGMYFYDAQTLEEYAFYPAESYRESENYHYFSRWPDGHPFSRMRTHAISSDGQIAVLAGDWTKEKIKGIRMMRVSDEAWLDEIPIEESVFSLAISPDGEFVASGMESGKIHIWQTRTYELLRTLEGHTDAARSVDFSPNGEVLVSGSKDATVRLWRALDGTLLHTLEGHTDEINRVIFSPSGEIVASGSNDGLVNIWRISDGKLLRTLEEHDSSVYSVAFSPDGQRLVSTSGDGLIRVWRVADGALLNTQDGHISIYKGLTFSPDSKILACAGWKTMRLYSAPDGELLNMLKHADHIWSAAFSPDGTLLATGTHGGPIRLWRIPEGFPVRTLEGHMDHVTGLAFTPDGKILASSSDDHTVKLWRVSDGELLQTLEGHEAWVRDVAISPDGEVLASAGWDGVVKLWKVSDGTLLDTIEGYSGSVMSVNFSPDGWTLAFSSGDKTARLWNFSEGELIHTLEGHTSDVYNAVFSPDGETLATNSITFDSTIRLWRVSDGELLNTLEMPFNWTWELTFSPDGTMLASGATDGVVRLWGIGTPGPPTPTPPSP